MDIIKRFYKKVFANSNFRDYRSLNKSFVKAPKAQSIQPHNHNEGNGVAPFSFVLES